MAENPQGRASFLRGPKSSPRSARAAAAGTRLHQGRDRTHAYFLRCGCNSCSLQVESNAAQDALVGRNVHGWLLGAGQIHELHVARVGAREGQEGVVTVGAQDAEA